MNSKEQPIGIIDIKPAKVFVLQYVSSKQSEVVWGVHTGATEEQPMRLVIM